MFTVKIDQRYIDLLVYRSVAELKTEAARAYLGVIWWLLEPILYVGVFYIVFGLVLKRGGEGYVAFLLCGLVFWKWFDSTVRTASGVIAQSVGLMGQVYFPKIVLPAIIVITNTFKFFVILAVLLIFIILYGIQPTIYWLALPVVIGVQFLFIAASAGLVSAIVPFIPDFRFIVNYGMTLLFFMSGIFFSLESIPDNLRPFFLFNPMVVIIDSFRQILLYEESPSWHLLGYVGLGSGLFMLLVMFLYKKCDRMFPRVVG